MKNKILKRVLQLLMLDGVKRAGSYEAQDVLLYIGEMLTAGEYQTCENFLNWVVSNGKTFGTGNINQVWNEYQAS